MMKLRDRACMLLARHLRAPAAGHVQKFLSTVSAQPTLQHMADSASLMTADVGELLLSLGFGMTNSYLTEYTHASAELRIRIAGATGHYPPFYVIEDGTAAVLYALVRSLSPDLMLELGVADGRSTQVVLEAMDRNGRGRLISVDVSDDVGGAAVGHPRWELRVHAEDDRDARQLRQLMTEIGSPDIFFHDAMHTYDKQFPEYLTALKGMRSGSLFLSDDADQSWAFVDVCRRKGLAPSLLVDRRKVFGAFWVP